MKPEKYTKTRIDRACLGLKVQLSPCKANPDSLIGKRKIQAKNYSKSQKQPNLHFIFQDLNLKSLNNKKKPNEFSKSDLENY